MPKRNKKFGDWGENMAETFLRKRGYELLGKNYRKQTGEIDLIARKEDTLHFIEVKTRTAESTQKYGLPEEAVSSRKQKRLIETAFAYLSEQNCPENINWQIDVVSIVYSKELGSARIKLLSNAFDESS